MSRMRAGAVLVALTTIVSLIIATRASGAPAPNRPTIGWHGCSGGFQCGTLTVPVADSTIDLAVIRRTARVRSERIGSLVFNPGGPGAPAVSFLRQIADTLPAPIRDRFDLVAFDPRGVGDSRPIECVDNLEPLFDQSFEPTTAAARAGLVAAVTTLADACAARNGALLGHVSTIDAAHDLERLRVALGDDRLSFVGFSYGTFLGASYASMYPSRVRAFVLDGPVDPTMSARDVTLAQARGFEHSLDDFLAYCSAHRACAFSEGGDAERAYDGLRARAAQSPIPASRGGGRGLNETRLDAAVLEELYLGRPAWPALAAALAAAAHGDASTLLDLADSFIGRNGGASDDHTLEAFWAVTCLDGPVIGDVTAAAALEAQAVSVAPRMGAFIANNSLPCSVWPVRSIAAPGRLEATGAPPILVIGTTRDPATPLAQARSLASDLDHGVLLVAAGEQHTSFNVGNECVDRAVTRYLVDRRVPRQRTRC